MPSVSRLLLVASLAGLAVFATACGDDDSGPSAEFPDVAGVYAISGTFDGYAQEEASITGTLEVTQATLSSGVLAGNLQFTLNFNGIETPLSAALTSASVTESGAIAWTMSDEGSTWQFDGNVSGETMSGRYTASEGSVSLPGEWSATTTGTVRLASANSVLVALEGLPVDR